MAKNYRLPFDLPAPQGHELLIDQDQFASMMAGDPVEVEAAELMAAEWTARADKAKTEPAFAVLIPRRFGLTSTESKVIANDAKHVREVSLKIFELIDRIATDHPDRIVKEINADVMGFGESRYLSPYLRPYLGDLLAIDESGTRTYQERLATVHMQRAIPEWEMHHTLALRQGMVQQLLDFAYLEDTGELPKKHEPGQT